MLGLKLISTARSLPKQSVHNDDLAKQIDTSDEWIFPRTGIHSRYFCGPEESTLTLTLGAGRRALEKSGLRPEEIGAVVVATVTPDLATPSMSCLLAKELRLRENIPALDINAACSGFVYGLEVARGFLSGSGERYALVVGAEQLSRLIRLEDRTTSVLFGDGAGACIVEYGETDFYASVLGSRGSDVIVAPGIYTAAYDGVLADGSVVMDTPFNHGQPEERKKIDHVMMNGREVFLFAIDILPKCLNTILEKTGHSLDQVDQVICHQANSRIIRNVIRHLKADPSKFFENMDHFGNTSGASIPLALSEMEDQGILKKGQKIVLVGFGAGLTFGAAGLRYEPKEVRA